MPADASTPLYLADTAVANVVSASVSFTLASLAPCAFETIVHRSSRLRERPGHKRPTARTALPCRTIFPASPTARRTLELRQPARIAVCLPDLAQRQRARTRSQVVDA